MRKLKQLFLLMLSMLFVSIMHAQGPKTSGVGGLMRSNGRIYVVVAVVVTILLGLLLYLVRLDRKIAKLEREN
jgi:uncharacterized membrane protein